MPFRHLRHLRHHLVPPPTPEQQIAAPLARLEQRIVGASTALDALVSDLGDVAEKFREMAAQIVNQAGGEPRDR